MLKLREGMKLYCYLAPVDMRKSIDGLNIVVSAVSYQDREKHLYVFRNKQCNKVKIVFWDRNGYVMYYKRLERRHFKFPRNKEGQMEITELQLKGLLTGLEFELLTEFDDYHFSDFA